MTTLPIEHTRSHLPEVIAQKVEDIAKENGITEFQLLLGQALLPQWDQTCPLPKNACTWYYTGGMYWLLSCDGNPYMEPIQRNAESSAPRGAEDGSLWVITLDDAGEHLQVHQYVPASPPQEEALTWLTFDVLVRGRVTVIAQNASDGQTMVEERIANLSCDDSNVPSLDLHVDECWATGRQ